MTRMDVPVISSAIALALGFVAAGSASQRVCDADLIKIDPTARTTVRREDERDAGVELKQNSSYTALGWSCTSGFVVVEGPGVYLLYEDKGQLTKLECQQASRPCRPTPSAQSLFSRLFAGGLGQTPGGKRMDKDVQVPAGLPVGRMYSLARAGTFDFSAAGAGPWSLVVSSATTRAPLVQRSGGARALVLPSGLLQRGGKYSWTVTIGGVRYSGGFDVLDSRAAAEVEQELREKGISGAGVDRSQKLDELLILYDHGLDYEAKLLARELGR